MRILVAVAVVLLAGCGPPTPHGQVAYTPAETACIKGITPHALASLNAGVAKEAADESNQVKAYASNGSQPDYDAEQARGDYTEAMRAIERNREYCTAFARCLASRPFKVPFDTCYSMMSEKEPDDNDAQPADD
jgi:hypothetical protein